jgi:hypothetical protein
MLTALHEPDMRVCTACFDGNYPCELGEMSEDNQKYLFEDSGNGEYY